MKIFFLMLALCACGGGSSKKEAPEPYYPVLKPSIESHIQWHFKAEGKVRSTAVFDHSNVYFGDESGSVYSLDKTSGQEVWKVLLDGAIDSKLAIFENIVLVVSGGGKFYALNSHDGSQLWSVELGEIDRSEYDYHLAIPVIYEGIAFIGNELGKLIGVELSSGQIVWQADIWSPSHTQPIIVSDKICISSMNELSCIDLASRNVIWTKAIQWPTSPASNGDSIVVGSREDYFIFSFNVETGEMNWQEPVVDWAPGDPIINNGKVYIGTSDNYAFLALDLDSGDRLWRAKSVANVFTKPVIVNDNIIFSSGYAYNTPGFGVLKSVNLEGETMWEIPASNFFSSPIVDKNSLYIGNDDQHFYSINLH